MICERRRRPRTRHGSTESLSEVHQKYRPFLSYDKSAKGAGLRKCKHAYGDDTHHKAGAALIGTACVAHEMVDVLYELDRQAPLLTVDAVIGI